MVIVVAASSDSEKRTLVPRPARALTAVCRAATVKRVRLSEAPLRTGGVVSPRPTWVSSKRPGELVGWGRLATSVGVVVTTGRGFAVKVATAVTPPCGSSRQTADAKPA